MYLDVTDVGPGQIHVWRVDVRHWVRVAATADQILSPGELDAAARLARSSDRRRYIVSHVALRQILAEYIRIPPKMVRFGRSEFGRPELNSPSRGIHFNLAHSGNWAVVASARSPVGVDIERFRPLPRLDALIRRNCTLYEQQTLKSLDQQARQTAFFQCWTAKEAVLKGVGIGLQGNAAQIDTMRNRLGDDMTEVRATASIDVPWRVTWFDMDDQHVGAVATTLDSPQVHHAQWPDDSNERQS